MYSSRFVTHSAIVHATTTFEQFPLGYLNPLSFATLTTLRIHSVINRVMIFEDPEILIDDPFHGAFTEGTLAPLAALELLMLRISITCDGHSDYELGDGWGSLDQAIVPNPPFAWTPFEHLRNVWVGIEIDISEEIPEEGFAEEMEYAEGLLEHIDEVFGGQTTGLRRLEKQGQLKNLTIYGSISYRGEEFARMDLRGRSRVEDNDN